MLTLEALDRLAEFDGKDARVLSVYLDLDPSVQGRRAYRLAFEDMVKTLRVVQDAAAPPQFSDEVARVQTFLEMEPPRGKGLVVFTCAPAVLWRADFLPARVPNHVAFEPRPDLAPLLRVLDEYERYGVALVDTDRARMFTVFLGEIEEHEGFVDPDATGRRDQDGGSWGRPQRHHEAHVYQHLKRVANRLAELHRQRRFDRLILAGPEEVTTELRRVLPRTLAHRVAAVIEAAVDAGPHEMLERTLAVERMVERQEEERLLQQLFDLAGPHGRSVLGVRPTLHALSADLVQTLVVAQSARGDGSECPECERLEPGRIERCPTCGAPMQAVHDIFHRAALRAVERSGRAEVVAGDAERRLMERGGGLGALLRVASPVPQAVR